MQTVSVVIPTWNRAGTIKDAVTSALNQTFQPLEVLVCDDGSTDETAEVIDGIGDPRVRWLPGPRAGRPAVPRNRGIRASRGDWLAFLDSDDLWQPDKLAQQLTAAEAAGVSAVCSNALRLLPGTGLGDELLCAPTGELTFFDLVRLNSVVCSSMLLKKDLFPKVEGFPEAICLTAMEDYALWLRVAVLTDIYFLAAPLVIYRDDPVNSLRSATQSVYEQRKRVFADFVAWGKKIQIPYRHRLAGFIHYGLANLRCHT